MRTLYRIVDGYWFPQGDIELEEIEGIPRGFVLADPTPLLASKTQDQWIVRTYLKGEGDPYWQLTNMSPTWDKRAYAERLEQAKRAKRKAIEASFSDRLTRGPTYDFGAPGIAAKTPFDGQEVPLRRRSDNVELDQTIIEMLVIDASNGELNLQARASDRGTFTDVKTLLLELAEAGVPSPSVDFKTAQNISISIDIVLWKQVFLTIAQWYQLVFAEHGSYKATVDAHTKIEDVEAFTWTWQN